MQKGESRGRTELLQKVAVNMQQLWEQEKTFEVQAPKSGDHGWRRSCCCITTSPAPQRCDMSAAMHFLTVALCLCPSLQLRQQWELQLTLVAGYAGEKVQKFFGNFPYPYMNGLLHLGHAFSLSKVSALLELRLYIAK